MKLFVSCLVVAVARASVFYPDIPEDGQAVSVFETQEFVVDFTNRSDFFVPSNQFRARKYLKMARKHYETAVEAGLKRNLAQEEAEALEEDASFQATLSADERMEAERRDVFLLVWLASQHINTMVTFGDSMPGLLAEACDMGLGLHQMPGDVSISTEAATHWCYRACNLNSTMVSKWASERVLHWSKTADLANEDRKQLRRDAKALGKGKCRKVEHGERLAPEEHWNQIKNPKPQPGKCEAGGTDQNCIPELKFNNLELWPTRMSTVHIDMPASFHQTLSDLAIERYHQHREVALRSNPNVTPEALNNGFFSIQNDLQRQWPKLLHSPEFRTLKKILHKAAVTYALRIGRWPEGADHPELDDADLFVWTAVYTEGTPHLTHCHDQGIVSGAYYSLGPDGVAPIVFTDPRGGQPMHIDSAGHAPETEPEAPFHQNSVFFPNSGDLVLFPSWLPHRVPPSASKKTRVVWSFNLNGPVNAWSRTATV